jgi:RNA polymerase sigma factor (TIGR02999 family)
MADVTQILSQIEQGNPKAAEELLPLIYDELRKLAAAKLANEKPGQTLQATALVHDAYIRLVDVDKAQHWDSRGHFFAAAAEAMRRILVDSALRKRRLKRGGDHRRVELDSQLSSPESKAEDVLAVDEALGRLACEDRQAAELVKLHFYAGCSIPQAAKFLGISRSNAYRQWAYARAALQCLLAERIR